MRSTWVFVAAVALVVAIAFGVRAAPAGAVRIGLFMGLTGPNAFLSEMGRQGVLLALEEVNKSGGVLGRQIELSAQDTRSVPAETVNAVRRLVTQDGIKLLIGPSGSGEALTVLPVVQELEAVWVMSLPSSPAITQRIGRAGNPWAFRTQQSDAVMAKALVDVAINKLGDKRIATVVRNDDFGRAGGEEFAKNVLPLGGSTTSNNFYTPGGAMTSAAC